MSHKNILLISTIIIISIALISVFFLIPLFFGGAAPLVSVGLLDHNGNPASMMSIVDGTTGVYYIYFDVGITNTGDVILDSVDITSASPLTLWNAFNMVSINNLGIGQSSTLTTWNPCNTDSDCTGNEECVGSTPKCAIPTASFESLSQPVRFDVTVRGSWTCPYGAVCDETSMTKTGYVDLDIQPNTAAPEGGFDVGIGSGGESGDIPNGGGTEGKLAGLAIHSAGHMDEHSDAYWRNGALEMSSKIPDSTPVIVWVLGYAWAGGICHLTFPDPGGVSDPLIEFSSSDNNEYALDLFDAAGIRVWLSIESMNADVDEIIDIILTKYGHHPSVQGVSVDVEWLDGGTYVDGRQVTTTEVNRWLDKVKYYDSDYKLLFWHWEKEKMPPIHPEDVVFAYDPQGFSDYDGVKYALNAWGEHFSSGEVSYLIGFDPDMDVFNQFSDPMYTVGNWIFDNIPNTKEVYWASWTYPETYGS